MRSDFDGDFGAAADTAREGVGARGRGVPCFVPLRGPTPRRTGFAVVDPMFSLPAAVAAELSIVGLVEMEMLLRIFGCGR